MFQRKVISKLQEIKHAPVIFSFIIAMILTTFNIAYTQEPTDSYIEVYKLDSIVVTAQKREELLQDIPVSVAFIPGRRVSEFEMSDLTELAEYVPNLIIEDGTQGAALVMRGIGNNGGTNYGFDSPVGTFIDGVYYGRNNHSWLPYMDAERIEVLRGPQSTLFGMNTVVGAISIISGQPTNSLTGYVNMSYDPEYENASITGAVSTPITKTLSGRLAFIKTSHDGYIHNTFLNKNVNGLNDEGGRATLLWRPLNRLSLKLKLEHLKRHQNGLSYQFLSQTTDKDALSRQMAADLNATFRPDLETSNGLEYRDVKSNAAVLTTDYIFDDFLLRSITSYTTYNGFSNIDVDGTGISMGEIRAEEDFNQVSQEFSMMSEKGKSLEYIAGLYSHYSKLNHDRLLDFTLGEYITTYAGTPEGEMQTYAGNFAQDFQTISAFSQVTWNINERLRIKGGFRLSRERKEASSYFDWMVPGTTDPTNALDPNSEEFSAANFVFHDVFKIERHTDSGIYKENSFLPELKIQWDMNKNIMFYAGWSNGQKSGGFNDRDNRGNNFSFDKETSTNYELGSKMNLLQGMAQLNVTLFRTEFKDMQVSVFDLRNLIFIVDNAAKALSQGIEADARWRMTNNFMITGSLGWLETAKYQEFLVPCEGGPGCINNVRDEGGENLNTPNLFTGLDFAYNTRINRSMKLLADLGINYRSKSQDIVNQDNIGIESVAFLNARIALTLYDQWSVALLGHNLTDERFIATREATLFTGAEQGEIRPPRTITMQVGYHF